jgi:predicted ester cyclase
VPATHSETNKRITRRYFNAYERGDIEAVMKFLDPHHVLHPGAGGEPQNLDARKRDEMVFFAAFSNIDVIVEDQIAEGNKVVSRITMNCTHTGEYQDIPATGKQVKIPYIDIVRIKAGKILEEWVEFDMMKILQQIRTSKQEH